MHSELICHYHDYSDCHRIVLSPCKALSHVHTRLLPILSPKVKELYLPLFKVAHTNTYEVVCPVSRQTRGVGWPNVSSILAHRLRHRPTLNWELLFESSTMAIWSIGSRSISNSPGRAQIPQVIQQTQSIHQMLVQCWSSVVDDGPTLGQHRVNASRIC